MENKQKQGLESIDWSNPFVIGAAVLFAGFIGQVLMGKWVAYAIWIAGFGFLCHLIYQKQVKKKEKVEEHTQGVNVGGESW